MIGLQTNSVFLLGAGGIGMSAIAHWYLDRGWRVLVADRRPSTLQPLLQRGAIVAKHAPHGALTIASSAIPQTDPLWQKAQADRGHVLRRPAWFATIPPPHIAVTGSHGKSTVTALLIHLFQANGYQPQYLVGAHLYRGNHGCGIGTPFIVEADESDASCVALHPDIFVITSVDDEHQDKKTIETLFKQCAAQAESTLHHQSVDVAGYSYGDAVAQRWHYRLEGNHLVLYEAGVAWYRDTNFTLGRAMAENFCAASGAARLWGLSLAEIARALPTFRGIRRRFEVIGTAAHSVWVDDYAHHPTEIVATLEQARTRYPRHTIVAIFQPHRFSRFQKLFHQFCAALRGADQVVCLPVDPAGEQPSSGTGSSDLVDVLGCSSCSDPDKLAEVLPSHTAQPHLYLALGAGSVGHFLKKAYETCTDAI